MSELFRSLTEKLEKVREYPDVRPADIDRALQAYQNAPQRARYHACRHTPAGCLVDEIVSVYRESVPATLEYARDRMEKAYRGRFKQWDAAYRDINDRTVRAYNEHPLNCIRIEVINFGAPYAPNVDDGHTIQNTRNEKSAHVGVIYGCAQNPEWTEALLRKEVPATVAGGYEIGDYGVWNRVPSILPGQTMIGLYVEWIDTPCNTLSIPEIWT